MSLRLWLQVLLSAANIFTVTSQTLDHFEFSAISSPRQAFVPFRATITARSSAGATVRSFRGTVQLTASGAGGAVAIESLSSLQFSSGTWIGILVFRETGSDVILRVKDATAGRSGSSAPIQVEPGNFRVIDLPVLSVANDQLRGVLYASVGPTNGPVGSIYVIDPASGNILKRQAIDGGVERLELSDDASKLYVVADDQRTVRRLRLPEFVEERVLLLGELEPGVANYAADLAVHPGKPDVVAVVKRRRGISPWFSGLSVFDDAVEKKTASVYIGESNAVGFGDKPGRLYGLGYGSPAKFNHFDIASTGLTLVTNRWGLLSGSGDIRFVSGKLYCSSGRILDPETFTLLGELPAGDDEALMLPLPDRQRIVYFTPATLGLMLTYDSGTLQLLGTEPFPMPRGFGSGVALWGTRGIAFHDGKRLFLAENRLIPTDQPADLEVTPGVSSVTVGGVGSDVEMQGSVQNLGPNSSGPVLLKVEGPVDTVLTGGSVVGLNVVPVVTDRKLLFELPSLPPGARADVRFTARSSLAAWQPFSLVATGTALDSNGSNNAAGIILKAAPLPDLNSPVMFRLGTTAMVGDPNRGTILAIPSATSAPWANSVVTINPSSGEVSQPVLVGSRPSELAISDDGKYLYVGFLGLAEVRRFLLPTLQPDLTIPLGRDGFSGLRFARQIEVRPGHPSEIAVARYNLTYSGTQSDRLGYFRDATDLLPDRGDPQLVRFGGPDRLFAYQDLSGIMQFDIAAEGLIWKGMWEEPRVYNSPGFTYDAGKIYFSEGPIFNVETGTPFGTISMFGPYGPPPIINRAAGRALFLQRTSTNYVIASFDLNSLTQVSSNVVDGLFGTANSLSQWSENGLAFSASAAIGMLRTDLLGSNLAAPRLEGVTLTPGEISIRLGKLIPGNYSIEQSDELKGIWRRAGDSFTELAGEVRITIQGQPRQFFRLVRLP